MQLATEKYFSLKCRKNLAKMQGEFGGELSGGQTTGQNACARIGIL